MKCPICNQWNVIVEKLPCVKIGYCNECGARFEEENKEEDK